MTAAAISAGKLWGHATAILDRPRDAASPGPSRSIFDQVMASFPEQGATSAEFSSSDVGPAWLEFAPAQLNRLLALPYGWDGISAPPLRVDVAIFALTLLELVADEGMPEPTYVPLPNGGLQLEWFTPDVEIEVEIVRPMQVQALREVLATGDVEEAALSSNFATLYAWLLGLAGEDGPHVD